jgi:O-antigen/teichoic acid export membrane protein
MQDLKAKTIRGSLARLCAQGASFILRVGSLVILARLLSPRDFGLVGMVTAFTGVLALFRDFGLSAAAVQYAHVTEEQISTLFWINVLLGAVLGLIALAMAPVVAAFYHEPQLSAVTVVLGTSFFFNAAGIQHSALLQREMRFTTLAAINVISLAVGIAMAIYAAKAEYGYWALVLMTVTPSVIATGGFWLAAGWVPGMPRRRAGIRNMVHFGGSLTLTGLLAYMAFNAEKVMVGRFWGVDAIGIYGRAWQIVFIPTDNLNSAVSEVAFSALSKLQNDSIRLRNYFLKGLSLFLGLMVPISIVCGLFADDIVFVILGPKWKDAVMIARLLAPTIAIFAILNPIGWLIFSIGLVGRALKIAPVLATIMITGYAVALPYGPKAVAFAYSAVLALWTVPHIWLCVRGTIVSVRDILMTATWPLASGVLAGGVAFGARAIFGQFISPWLRVFLESGILFLVFYGLLLFVAGQKSLYLDLLGGLRKPSSTVYRS